MSAVRALHALLIAFAIALPFAPLAGPLSLDDVLPLLGVGLGLLVVPTLRGRPQDDPVIIALLVFAALGAISSAANAESLGALARLAGRSTGRTLFYLVLLVQVRQLFDRPERVRAALAMVVAAAALEASFSVWAFVTQYRGPLGIGIADIPSWSVLSGQVRVHGTFSGVQKAHETALVSANFLGAYLVMTIPITVGLALDRARWVRALLLVLAVVQLTAMVMTYTRASLLALALSALVFGWWVGRRTLAVALVAVAALGTFALPTLRDKVLNEGHNRYALWSASLETTAKYPLTGVGDGNYMRVLAAHPEFHETRWGVVNATAHNSTLLSAAHHGILGGATHALLYLLIVLALLSALRTARPEDRLLTAAVGAALVGYLVQDQFNNLAYVPKVATQLWFLFGLLPGLAFARPAPQDG